MQAQVTTALIRVDRMNDFRTCYQESVASVSESIPGFKGLYLLMDRSNGKAISLTLRDLVPGDRTNGRICEDLALSPPVVEDLDVSLYTMFTLSSVEKRRRPHARVTIARTDPARLNDAIVIMRDKVIPAAKEEQGFKGLAALTNEQTGKAMIVTLWETIEDLEDSEISGYYQQQLSRFGRIFTELPVREYFEVTIQNAAS